MNVFISWSGVPSREVAEALHWWLPKVIQGVKPYVSAKDIDKGATWSIELSRELEATDFGIICLNAENLTSPWLNYEAGAITRSVLSRVCPVLHGLEKRDVKPPLGQLQLTSLEQDDFFLMMKSMNAVFQKVHDTSLSDVDLIDAFDVWWPQLEARLLKVAPAPAALRMASHAEPQQPENTADEMLTELLHLVRALKPGTEASSGSRPTSGAVVTPVVLARFLAEDGLSVTQISVMPKGTTVYVSHLPSPLPARAYGIVGDYARDQKTSVRVEDETGRVIEFDKKGYSDDPPF